MNQEVFQSNKVILFLIVGAFCMIATVVYFQAEFPIWILPIVYIVGVFIIFTSLKTKVIIENGKLRYEKLGGGEEVDLKNVAQIIVREVETIVDRNSKHESSQHQGGDIRVGSISVTGNQRNVDQERKVERIVYVLDLEGRTVFSFPANIIRFTQRSKFRDAIHIINPNIEVF